MDAVAYVRVSSKAQGHAMQKNSIEQAARARGDEVVKWYADKMTGGVLSRPALDKLRADVRAGKVRRIYVYRLDRLTRSGIRDTLDVVDELRRHGCALATVSDGFDLDGPAAEVVLAVLSWAAKMERLAINERIASARTRVEAEGGAWGRPARMTDEEVAKARRLRAEGCSVRQVAEALDLPSSTVGRAVKGFTSATGPS